MNKVDRSNVGICDMSLYVPKLYLNIQDLAEERNIPFDKLRKGLGLQQMRIPDVHEDAATMAANAVYDLMEKNQLKPQEVGRIYLGTESALDGAKPTATYVLEMLRRKYREVHGVDCFRNCDVVDLTFACVGAVDALQNTLDWVRGNENRKGIVVAADFAKYELDSGGEYTQGAGAIAMLVKHNPKLIVIDDIIGVATQGVHDFFKPRRTYSKAEIVDEVLQAGGIDNLKSEDLVNKLSDSLKSNRALDANERNVQVFKETPVFDGQYSNWTYQNRIREAYLNFCQKQTETGQTMDSTDSLEKWDRLIFHLPYAYHGRRIASELFMHSLKAQGKWEDFAGSLPPEPVKGDFENEADYEKARSGFLRSITKTDLYQSFVDQKLEKAERASSYVGNMYACSIFLALMSTLETDFKENTDLSTSTFGFFGYGSGSKSKVFEGRIQDSWKSVVANFQVIEKLNTGIKIDYAQYEKIHREQLESSINHPENEFRLDKLGTSEVRLGARYYEWEPKR